MGRRSRPARIGTGVSGEHGSTVYSSYLRSHNGQGPQEQPKYMYEIRMNSVICDPNAVITQFNTLLLLTNLKLLLMLIISGT